ncbi:MAG: hypothetical protein ACRD3D_02090 [Terriglobia bacterium]
MRREVCRPVVARMRRVMVWATRCVAGTERGFWDVPAEETQS